jgi:hypothetical protein
MMIQFDNKAHIETSLDALKLALVSSDPAEWLYKVYEIEPTIEIEDPQDFLGKDGQYNFDNQTIKWAETPTPEEAAAKLQDLLGQEITIGPEDGSFWRADG